MKRKSLLIGLFLILGLAVAVYGFKDILRPQPRPHQEIVNALAEYGWEVKDIEVDTLKRIILMAVIPPEDDEGYANGFFCILEWADEIVKPPLSEGKPVQGIYPGVLMIGELTPDGPRVLLLNGKVAQAHGTKRMMMLTWEAVSTFLGEGPDGRPWRETFEGSDKIYQGVYQLSWFRIAYYEEYDTPVPFAAFDNGWFKKEKPDEYELLDEPKS